MNFIAKRTVTLIKPQEDDRFGKINLSLIDFESDQGYVLLGEPGMGKSTAFIEEARRIQVAPPISARRFVIQNPENHPEHKTDPLFIDGLDEARVGRRDPRDAIDKIINRLDNLRTPRFRISCRLGNWLGEGDLQALSSLLRNREIPVLQLNPLNYNDIKEIISQQETDAESLILQAHDHGLGSFLNNPQLLNLLLQSIKNDGWCRNPTETFEQACRQLAREYNCEHRDAHANPQKISENAILNGAGLLSAFLLIGGRSGWSTENTADPDSFSLSEIDTQSHPTLFAALHTSIFAGASNLRTPIHRLLAEFLAARYLAEKIRTGLSPRRVLSLLIGYDGRLLSDLEGLAAWLAAFNRDIRSSLIQLNPIAVAFNGDASNFMHNERQILFRSLEHHICLIREFPREASLGTLAGNQGFSEIWELTSSPERSENRQDLVYALMRGIFQTVTYTDSENRFIPEQQMEISKKNLLQILYDSSWRLNIRSQALYILNEILSGQSNHGVILRKLLEDLKTQQLKDENYELLGMALEFSYPGELQPKEVWEYLIDEPFTYPVNTYLNFFSTLDQKIDQVQIKGLLDALCDQASEIMPRLANKNCHDLVPNLLAKGISLLGDQLNLQELYRWFELVIFDDHSSQLTSIHSVFQLDSDANKKANNVIRNWLNERKIIQHELIEYSLVKHEHIIGDIRLDRSMGRKFMGVSVTRGFRIWCLNRAIELSDVQPKVATELARWSFLVGQGWKFPLSDEEITERVSDVPNLCEWNLTRLAKKTEEEREEAKRKEQKFPQTKFEIQRQYELSYLREHKDEVISGRCPPEILDKLARIYFYDRLDTESPKTWLKTHLDDDPSLLDAVLKGFQSLLDRKDLPDLHEIAEIHEKGQRSYFARPFLAALELSKGNVFSHLSKTGRRRAIGFYLVTNLPQPQHSIFNLHLNTFTPLWYKYAMNDHPQAVADAMIEVHRACVQSKTHPVEHLFRMANDETEEYAKVASLAVGRKMITIFPTKCSGDQLHSLYAVLLNIIKLYDQTSDILMKEELEKIVLKRLNRKNMDIAQQAPLLCTGLCIVKENCFQRFIDFLSTGRSARIRHVFNFLELGAGQVLRTKLRQWSSGELSRFIQTVGYDVKPPVSYNGPHTLSTQEFITIRFQDLLNSCTKELSSRIDNDTILALSKLESDPNLVAWKRPIQQAQEVQTRRKRTAKKIDLSLTEIQGALQNAAPANVADLKNLTVDVLEDLAYRIRDYSTNDWRQYWNRWPSSHDIRMEPKHENVCRDILLSDLELKLEKFNVDVSPEAQYAEEKRADIRVSYGSSLAIPIEVKKSSHHNIWRGITHQLVPKYTRDPKADGFGIYLVFWFGAQHMNIAPPSGRIPKSPQELKHLLENQIPPELEHMISVVVIDVNPNGEQ
ncbi:MAG: hypothetical protein OXF48_04345 [Bacteroidetes bacterium]|nr:hypothetical protein [Bacteroidota bacterium]